LGVCPIEICSRRDCVRKGRRIAMLGCPDECADDLHKMPARAVFYGLAIYF